MSAVRTKGPSSYYREVEISAGDLAEDGWHHHDNCPNEPAPFDFVPVVVSLHRQAHPSQHPWPPMCHEEPCRSLPIALMRQS